MGLSVTVLVLTVSLHLIAFVFAVGAERRRSKALVEPDQYDERTFCKYTTDASTVYGLSAFGLLLISQVVVNGVTRCLCFGRGILGGGTTRVALFFAFSWLSFLAAEACLLAGSARNAYHTRYRAIFHVEHLSCATLRSGVFAAGAALTIVSLIASILYYWAHSKADTGGWVKHQNEGVDMTPSHYGENRQEQKGVESGKV